MLTVSLVSARGKQLAALWSAAAVLAALGVALNFNALPGLNWGLWTACVVAGFALTVRASGKALTPEIALPLVLACVLASGATLTANPLFYPLILGGTIVLLGTALQLAGGTPVEEIDAAHLALAPLTAGLRTAQETLVRAAETAELLRAERSMPLVRGVAFAIPVVIVFALLLAGADPIFAAGRDALGDALAHFTIIPQLMMFGALGVVVLGSYGYALRTNAPRASPMLVQSAGFRVGHVERLIVLASVVALFALFLVLQVTYLFGDPGARVGSGVTFAEAARHGFGEISIVATLSTLLILVLDRSAVRGTGDGRAKLVALVLVGEVQLLLHSAYRRMDLYADAYGYTTTRLYVQVYLVVVSLTLIALAWEVWGGIDVPRLTRRAALLTVGAVIALAYWNHEAWIVRQNVGRYEHTGKIDLDHLATAFSLDAAPELTRVMARMPAPMAAELATAMHAHFHRVPGVAGQRLIEWSARRGRGVDALLAAGVLRSSDVAQAQARHRR